VIIPVRDDAAGLEVALDGLRHQLHPPDEVIIANASDKSLASPTVAEWSLRVIEVGPSFPGKARNAGARAADNEWLAFLDAGARPTPDWLSSFYLAAEQTPDVQVIYGCYLPNVRDEWDWAAAGVYLPPRLTPDVGCYPTTASLCVRRGFWDSTAGMPENLRAGEDLLFFRDIETRHVLAVTAPRARVVWDLPAGAWAHFRRLRRYSAATWPTELARRWHWPLIRMYAGALAMISVIPVLHPAWAGVVPALVAARVARNYHRRMPGLLPALTPIRVLRLVAMTGLVDAATLLGIWDSLSRRRP
jgi:hypothetical protein